MLTAPAGSGGAGVKAARHALARLSRRHRAARLLRRAIEAQPFARGDQHAIAGSDAFRRHGFGAALRSEPRDHALPARQAVRRPIAAPAGAPHGPARARPAAAPAASWHRRTRYRGHCAASRTATSPPSPARRARWRGPCWCAPRASPPRPIGRTACPRCSTTGMPISAASQCRAWRVPSPMSVPTQTATEMSMMFIEPNAAMPKARTSARPSASSVARRQAGDHGATRKPSRASSATKSLARAALPRQVTVEPARRERGTRGEHIRLRRQRLFHQPHAGTAGEAGNDKFDTPGAVRLRDHERRDIEWRCPSSGFSVPARVSWRR